MANIQSDINDRITKFVDDVKYERIIGSYNIAIATVKLLQRIVSHTKWNTAQELMDNLKAYSKVFVELQRVESVVHNMICRVLKLIREDYVRSREGQDDIDPESLHSLMSRRMADRNYTMHCSGLKSTVMESIGYLIREIEDSRENIAVQAADHISSGETILTLGRSQTVEEFLKRAATKHKFRVIVVEGAPYYHGHELALNLAKQGIEITVIPDTAMFTIMKTVSKVIIGTHAVFGNGGLKAFTGSHVLSLCAQRFSVDFIVLAAQYKLSPEWYSTQDQHEFNKMLSPKDVLPFDKGDMLSQVEVYNPLYDRVKPERISLFITNTGVHAPFFFYRLRRDIYHPDDKMDL